jgi:hypothetical protein
MIQRIFATFLILIILSAQFSKLFVFAGFELNKNYIAFVLCENKDLPEMQCEGKCFLKKKLQEVEKKQAQQEKQLQKQLFQEIATVSSESVYFPLNLLSEINTPIHAHKELNHVFPILQPPS